MGWRWSAWSDWEEVEVERREGWGGWGGRGVAEANKNNPLQLDQTASVQKPVVPSLERAAAVIFSFPSC